MCFCSFPCVGDPGQGSSLDADVNPKCSPVQKDSGVPGSLSEEEFFLEWRLTFCFMLTRVLSHSPSFCQEFVGDDCPQDIATQLLVLRQPPPRKLFLNLPPISARPKFCQ